MKKKKIISDIDMVVGQSGFWAAKSTSMRLEAIQDVWQKTNRGYKKGRWDRRVGSL